METDYQALMANKPDKDLITYLETPERFVPAAIKAAIHELQKRGKQFSEQELAQWEASFEERKKTEETGHQKGNTNYMTKNIVTDPSAPAYYSLQAIWGFSMVFSVVFGAVLLSSNLKDKDKAWGTVLIFGFLYTLLAVTGLSFFPRSTAITIVVNAAGALIMTHFFWNKYIGENTKYRAKPIWKPLIVSLLITIPFVVVIIMFGGLD